MPSTPNTPASCAAPVRDILFSLFAIAAVASASANTTTTGYQNVARTVPPGTLLSHPMDAGNESHLLRRTTNVNYLRGWLIVGPFGATDSGMRIYDISDPSNPARRHPHTHFGHAYTTWHGAVGWNAHGSAQTEDTFLHPAITVSSFGGAVSRGSNSHQYPMGFNRSSMQGPQWASMLWYGNPPAQFEMGRYWWNTGTGRYASATHGTIDHVQQFGSGDWHPLYFGDLLIYVRSDDSSSNVVTGRDGVVVYRIRYEDFGNADLSRRKMHADFVASLSTGFSGYWPNLYSDGARLYVVGGSSGQVMVADVTNAADPLLPDNVTLAASHATALNNATYPVYQDNFAFIHNKKFDMSLLLANHPDPVVLALDEFNSKQAHGKTQVHPDGVDTTQMSLPLGNLWLTGGYPHGGKSPGMAVWVQGTAPDTRKPTVAFHIPQAGRGGYPRHAPLSFLIHEVPRRGAVRPGIDFTVRPVVNGVLGAHVAGYGLHDMSGVYTYTPAAPLAADTEYQVDFLSSDNGTPNNLDDDIGFQDAAGNLMDAYGFRFSTGSLTPPTPPTLDSFTASNYQPSANTHITVTASAQGAGLEYRFNVNGSWSAWGGSASQVVSYPAPGRYRVMIQVRNSAGGVANSFVNILVPPTGALANAPTHSNSMAIGNDSGGRRLWVVNPDSNTVSVLNAATGAKLHEHPVGKNPRSIARDKNGRYWVTLMDEDRIVILNQNGSIQETITSTNAIPYGAQPFAIAPNHDGSLMFVSYYGLGRLARFTVPDGDAAVTTWRISAAAQAVPTARAIAVRTIGTETRVFVTRFISENHRGEVVEFNGVSTNLSRTRVIALGYVQDADAGDNGAGLPNYLAGISITPDGKYALVTGKKDNIGRGLLFTDPSPPAGQPLGVGDLTPINTVRAMMAVIDLTTHGEVTAARRDFDNSDSPTSITFSSRGDTAFVALQGNNRVVGIDSINPTAAGGSALISVSADADLAPQGVLYDAATRRLYVQNFLGRSVTVLNVTDFHDKNLGDLPLHVTTPTVGNELLNPLVLEGKRVFYNAADIRMSEDSYISCASCHVDGGHDGRAWDFTGRGEGLRRTTDLRGRAGMAHGNVHWTGNFDEIEDFEHDIRDFFGGEGFLPLTKAQFDAAHPNPGTNKKDAPGSEELNALAAYVSSLGNASVPRSPHRQPGGAFTTASGSSAVQGKLLFDGSVSPFLNCAACHAGSKLTDSIVAPPITGVILDTLDNVGTLITGNPGGVINNLSGKRLNATLPGIDVPSLLGLHASHGYLHHGLATTLDSVFTFAGGKVYQAEGATPVFLYTAPEVQTAGLRNENERMTSLGGGGQIRGLLGAKGVRLTSETGGGQTHPDSQGLLFTGVDGGGGGTATVYIRASSGGNFNLHVRANSGTETTVAMPGGVGFAWTPVELALNAGSGNTIRVRRFNGSQSPIIDAIMVAHAGDRAAAVAHRQVLDLTSTQRGDLLAYLRQIDGRDAEGKLRDPDLVLHYTFDEGSGNTLNDVSGNGSDHTTTLATTQWLGDGKFGGSMGTTNGTTAFASFNPANHADLPLNPRGDAFTISAWVKTNTATTFRTVFAKGVAGSRQVNVSSGNPTGSVLAYTGNTNSASHTSPSINDNQWHLVTLVNYNDNGTWRSRIYLNGGSTFKQFNSGSTTTTAAFRLGAASDGWNSWHGQIDDFRVYKRALTPSEIEQIFAGQEPTAP
jgi:YVTN family beta-propeller protein